MKIDDKIKSIIDAVQAGKLDEYLKQIDNSDFGLYIPAFEEHGIIKPMKQGYSQTERNLVVSLERKDDDKKSVLGKSALGRKVHDTKAGLQKKVADPKVRLDRKFSDPKAGLEKKVADPLVVGWFGRVPADVEDSTCGHSSTCNHCTHCNHSNPATCDHSTPGGPHVLCFHDSDDLHRGSTLGWPMLDYHKVVKEIDNKQDLLHSLSAHGLGLTLLHGHSDKYMFTTLPEGYVSVIANGVTTFREEGEVEKDKTFVPNMWRSINGKLHVAGGYSQIDAKKIHKTSR